MGRCARAAAALALLVAGAAFPAVAAADEVPYDAAPPFLSGPVQEGVSLVLDVAAGGWGGKHLTFTYAWQRCDASGGSCVAIPGATTTTGLWSDEYVVTAADARARLRVLVTATNSLGSTTGSSNLSVPIPPPGVPLSPAEHGTLAGYDVYSPAVRRVQPVEVYFPPGYARGTRRYPVLYLLHGFPGSPSSFVHGLAVAAAEDELLAEHLMRPLVLVMPDAAPDAVTETSWLDGVRTGRWETYVAHDVVRWVDGCFRVLRSAAGRGVAGLSDGGFGALVLAFHHPGEFRLAESWSGFEHADVRAPALPDATPATYAYDSPALDLARAARPLRRHRVYFWLYVGADDSARADNVAFAAALAAARIPHAFLIVPGSHLPSVYRANLPAALRVASRRLAAASPAPPVRPSPACPAPTAASSGLPDPQRDDATSPGLDRRASGGGGIRTLEGR